MEKVNVQQTYIGLLKWDVYSEYANQSDFIATAGTLYEKASFWLSILYKHANMLNAFMCVFLGCIYQGVNQEKISGATLTDSMTQSQCMASWSYERRF